jgi:hypothetical protein
MEDTNAVITDRLHHLSSWQPLHAVSWGGGAACGMRPHDCSGQFGDVSTRHTGRSLNPSPVTSFSGLTCQQNEEHAPAPNLRLFMRQIMKTYGGMEIIVQLGSRWKCVAGLCLRRGFPRAHHAPAGNRAPTPPSSNPIAIPTEQSELRVIRRMQFKVSLLPHRQFTLSRQSAHRWQ